MLPDRDPRPLLVAPDKFKGTFTAAEIAAAVAAGLEAGGRSAEALPVADGGDGTAAWTRLFLTGRFRQRRWREWLNRDRRRRGFRPLRREQTGGPGGHAIGHALHPEQVVMPDLAPPDATEDFSG